MKTEHEMTRQRQLMERMHAERRQSSNLIGCMIIAFVLITAGAIVYEIITY